MINQTILALPLFFILVVDEMRLVVVALQCAALLLFLDSNADASKP